MQLKVSEAAQYIGLANDTLRYYERMGIVTPHRLPESDYRIYNDWDLHFLMDTKWYRSLGLNLSDVTEIVRSDGKEDILKKCERQSAELLHMIAEYQGKLMALHKHMERIQRIEPNLGVFSHTSSPAVVYQRHQLSPDPSYAAQLQRWKDLFPHVSHTFAMNLDELKNLNAESEPYFGFSMTAGNALKYHIDPVAPAQFFPSQHCLYTVFEAWGPGTFINAFREQVLNPVQKEHIITGVLWGNLIVRYHEDGKLRRFFEVWIPVSE